MSGASASAASGDCDDGDGRVGWGLADGFPERGAQIVDLPYR
jgi:hypothetical protein